MTIKEIRKQMRGLKEFETMTVAGYGQIQKIGKGYAVGPLAEDDDSNIYTDYSAWVYGWKEAWVLDSIKTTLNID